MGAEEEDLEESFIVALELTGEISESSKNFEFCMNCNSVIFQESSKVSKIFRRPEICQTLSRYLSGYVDQVNKNKSKSNGNETAPVSLPTAISVITFNAIKPVEDFILCGKCGKLLEFAYNAVVDFTNLTKKGSSIQEQLVSKKVKRRMKASGKSSRSSKKTQTETETTKTKRKRVRNKTPKEETEGKPRKRRKGKAKKKPSKDSASTKSCDQCAKSLALGIEVTCNHKKSRVRRSKPRQRKSSRRQGRLASGAKNGDGVSSATDSYPYCCPFCDLEFKEMDQFETHLKLHDDMIETIETQAMDTERDGNAEDEGDTLPPEQVKCKFCGESGFSSTSDMKEHYDKEHPLVSILTFEDMHGEMETEAQPSDNAKDESSTSDDDQRYKKYTLKVALNSGQFIFRCNVCEKKFIRHDHIRLHLRTHTGEKPYFCTKEGCGKSFSDPRGLVYHEITHSNDRPYCCKFCGLTFKRLHHLNDHEKNHAGVPRRFTCQFCDKAFKHRKHLNSHAIIHQGIKNHQCSLCFKMFNRKDNLRQHMKKMHPDPSSSADVEAEFNESPEEGASKLSKPTKEIKKKASVRSRKAKIPTDIQPAKTDNQVATSDLQVATTDPQVATTDLQDATTDPQLATTDLQVATTDPQVATTDLQVATTDPQVATTDLQVATTDPQVATTNLQVTTSDLHSASSNLQVQVATTDFQAASSNFQVATTDFQAATSNLQVQVATSDLQVATTDPQVATTNFQAATTDFQAATTDFQAATTDFQATTTDFQATTSNLQVQVATTDFQAASSNFQIATTDPQVATTDFQAATSNLQVATADFQAATTDFQAVTSNLQGATTDLQLTTCDFTDLQVTNSNFQIANTDLQVETATQPFLSTNTPQQTVLIETSSGIFTTATVIAGTLTGDLIIPQVTLASNVASTPNAILTPEVTNDTTASATSVTGTDTVTFPVSITITDQTTIDQIVYMHL